MATALPTARVSRSARLSRADFVYRSQKASVMGRIGLKQQGHQQGYRRARPMREAGNHRRLSEDDATQCVNGECFSSRFADAPGFKHNFG